jgi:hypothetical protein
MCSVVQAALAGALGAFAALVRAPRRLELAAAEWLRDALEDSTSGGVQPCPPAAYMFFYRNVTTTKPTDILLLF